MAIFAKENNALLLKNDRSVVEFYKGNKKIFGYNNSVKGKMITANNVCPTKHKLKVSLSSDTITDFSGVKVTRCGKNLFDGSIKKGLALKGSGNNRTVITNSNDAYKIIKVKPNTTYYVSGDFSVAKDNTVRVASFTEFPTENSVSNKFSYKLESGFAFTTTADDNYLFIWIVIPSKITGIDIQVEEGSLETNFETYNPQIVKANADGTVKGMMSLSANMTLFTDNSEVKINCNYITSE